MGNPDAIVAPLADDVTWWISPTVPADVMPSVSTGKEVVRGNMQRAYRSVYNGETVRVTVHSAYGEGNLGTVRFALSCEFISGGAYSNEYCMCVETRGDEIVKVCEYVDVAHAAVQSQAAGIDLASAGSS